MLKIWSKSYHPDKIKELELLRDSGVQIHYPSGSAIPSLKEGDVLLCMGGQNLKAVQEAGFLPKNRTITSMREKLHPLGEGHVFVTFDIDINVGECFKFTSGFIIGIFK